MSPQGETEVVLEKPKRAPRKRTPKAVLSDNDTTSEVVKSVSRKRAPRKITPPSKPDPKDERGSDRKAPTPIAAQRARTKRGRKNLTVVAILLLLGIGSSAAVGFTDKGQIDVALTIAQRNEAARAAGQPEIIIPVQTTLEPNGGLTGVGDDPAAQPAQASTTPTTASSTESTASTTEEALSVETATTT